MEILDTIKFEYTKKDDLRIEIKDLITELRIKSRHSPLTIMEARTYKILKKIIEND